MILGNNNSQIGIELTLHVENQRVAESSTEDTSGPSNAIVVE